MSINKIISVLGARPQFVKAAPVSRVLANQSGLNELIIHTGQHYDPALSGNFFHELGIPEPVCNLGIGGGGHGTMTGRMLEALEPVFQNEWPDLVLVYGDTNSTLAGALAASKLQIPVAHVEAGLRSFNSQMPEEINRVLCDHVSTLLFCPTEAAVQNLTREGITRGVEKVGDVMYDAALQATARANDESRILKQLGLVNRRFVIATIHRAENTESPEKLSRLFSYLREEAHDQTIVFPLHPRTQTVIERAGLSLDGLMVIPPCGYLDMHQMLQNATAVYTDSGGLQREAYFHRVPCTTLRDETEWVETIENGWNRLWHESTYLQRRDITEYGDGNTAERIAARLNEWLNKDLRDPEQES